MEFMSQTFMVLDKNLNQVHVFLYAVSGFKCSTLHINYFHSMLFYHNHSQIQENPDISNRQNFYGHSEGGGIECLTRWRSKSKENDFWMQFLGGWRNGGSRNQDCTVRVLPG